MRFGRRRAGGAALWSVALAISSGASAGPAEPHDRRLASVDRALERAVARGVFPGAVVIVGRRTGIVHVAAVGRLAQDASSAAVTADTIYDLASVTKAVATATAAMALVDVGRLDLDAPVRTYLSATSGAGWDKVRVRDLLTHSSGLPAWSPLSREATGSGGIVRRILGLDFEYAPGSRSVYSDLGMIVLGAVVERVVGKALDVVTRERIFDPLRMRDTGFRPPAGMVSRIAPTGDDPWRGRLVRGEVRDENAYAMGGVAGHAGLFSTGADLSRFAEMLLNGGQLDGHRVLEAATVDRMTTRCNVPGSSRTLGWEMAAGDPYAGRLWSGRAYGHTGITGTALWIDPALDVYVVFLSNRDASSSEADAFGLVRRDLCDLALNAIRSWKGEQ